MEPPSSTIDDYFSLGIPLILILFFYALAKGYEMAFFSLSGKDLDQLKADGSKSSKRALKQLANPEYIKWTIRHTEILLQIAVLFIVADLYYRFFSPGSLLLLVALLILVLTAIILKYSGVAFNAYLSDEGSSRKFVRRISWIFSVLLFINYPLNQILSIFSSRLRETREERDAHSMEEFTEVEDATDMEEVEEKKLLKGIVGLSNTRVFQIMKPRVEIVSIDMDMSSQQVINRAIECGFSRLPVYKDSPDNIKGFLYIKDLVRYLKGDTMDFDWHKHIREAYFVPGSKKINDLLEEFRHKKMHLALVVDEYGGTDGIVTLEDILEEIVGEISDETDKNE